MIKLITFLSPVYVCVFWFIIYIVQSDKSKHKLVLSIFFISASLQFIGNYLMFSSEKYLFVWYDFLYIFSSLTSLPLLFIYFKLIIQSTKISLVQVLPHFFLPFLFSMVNIVIVLLMSEQEHRMYIDYYLDTSNIVANSDSVFVNLNSYLNIFQRAFFGFQIILYITLFVFLIQRFRKKILNSYSNFYLRDLLWIKYYRCLIVLPAIFLLLMNSFGKQPFIESQYAMLIPSTIFVFVLFFWGLVGNHQSQVIVDIENDDLKGEFLLIRTKSVDVEVVKQKLYFLMNNDELFVDKDIKLLDLCVLLNVRSEELRKILKQEFKMNFYTYINSFRVKKAKLLIKQKQYNSVQDILDKSGFIYLREFVTIYKKIEKQSPDII